MSNFFLGFPIHAIPGLYDRGNLIYNRLVFVTLTRLGAIYAAVGCALYPTPWQFPVGFLALGLALYGLELVTFRAICAGYPEKQLPPQKWPIEFAVFFFVANDPTNFVFDTTSDVSGPVQRYTHYLQVATRSAVALVLVVIEVSWGPYKRAWSCYKHGTPLKSYTYGYCPQYTHDWEDSWACAHEGLAGATAACRDMPESKAWSVRPPAWHVAVVMAALLYGFHAAGTLLDFRTKRMVVGMD